MRNSRLPLFLILFLFFCSIDLGSNPLAGTGEEPSRSMNRRMLVRIEFDNPQSFVALRDMHLDLASHNLKSGADVVVTEEELREIERRGFTYTVLIADPASVTIDPEFRDYEETVAYLDTLSRDYPDLTVLEQIGTGHVQGLAVWALKITDNPDIEEDEPEILYTGVTHAREPLGNEICLAIATRLLEGYGTEPDITHLVDSEEIWIVPIVNVEGFKYLMDEDLSDPWWRKNLRDNNNSGAFEEDFDGVDLNRNYDFNWVSGGSSTPESWTYRGPDAFSEAETRNIRDLALDDHRFIFSVSYHSYGEEVIWPWGSWPCHPSPDQDVNQEIAEEVASRITRRSGSGTYTADPIEGTIGYSTNWLYGVHGSIDFTIETCNEFIPAGTAIDSVVEANLSGAFYLLERALVGPGITGHVTDSESGDPLQARVTVIGRDNDDIEPRTCEPNFGRYFRMLPPGLYAVMYELEGYDGAAQEITVGTDTLTILDVQLTKIVDVSLSETVFDDDQTGQSSGNGDGILNPGEAVELAARLENVGSLTAYGVSCTLSTGNPLITLINATTDYGDIGPGEILEGDVPFVFSLSEDARDGDTVSLQLTAADTSSNIWHFDEEILVHAPEIDYFSRGIDDSEGGDGDGNAEAGEMLDLIVALRNSGSVGASGVWARLSTDDPFITIPVDSSFFGDMGAGGNAVTDPPYTISISPDVMDTHTVTLTIAISADDYYEEEEILLNLSPVGIDGPDTESQLPRVTQLLQNYPNPFNPSTKIEFDIAGEKATAVPVRLAVYSMRGRLVRILFSKGVRPGHHSVTWDGRDENGAPAGSGVYLLVLKTPGGTRSLKMIIQK